MFIAVWVAADDNICVFVLVVESVENDNPESFVWPKASVNTKSLLIGLIIKLISGQKIKHIEVFFSETKGPLFSVNSS